MRPRCIVHTLSARLLLLALVLSAAAVYAEGAEVPSPPESIEPAMLGVLRHGVLLLEAGDAEFAAGHFRAALPGVVTKVHINTAGAPPEYRDDAARAAAAAIDAWNRALPGLVQFASAEKEEEAQVRIVFEFDVADRERDSVRLVCGQTLPRLTHDGKGIRRSALVRVAVFPHGAGGHAHSYPCLCHVVGHELGHALGLGESSDKADIMGPDEHREAPSVAPSQHDVDGVKQLAALAQTLVGIAESGGPVTGVEKWRPAKTEQPAGAAG